MRLWSTDACPPAEVASIRPISALTISAQTQREQLTHAARSKLSEKKNPRLGNLIFRKYNEPIRLSN